MPQVQPKKEIKAKTKNNGWNRRQGFWKSWNCIGDKKKKIRPISKSTLTLNFFQLLLSLVQGLPSCGGSRGGLAETLIAGLALESLTQWILTQLVRVCFSNKLPGAAEAAGPANTL